MGKVSKESLTFLWKNSLIKKLLILIFKEKILIKLKLNMPYIKMIWTEFDLSIITNFFVIILNSYLLSLMFPQYDNTNTRMIKEY